MADRRQHVVLCLVQCGATIWDAERRVHGSTDLPLSEFGRRELDRTLQRRAEAAPAMIHHPGDEAASETAKLAAQAWRARTKVAAELADPNLGLLEGLSHQDFEDRFPSRHRQWEDEFLSVVPPEGEAIAAAASRIFKAVASLVRRSRSDEVAVVLHDLGAGLLRAWMADRPLNDLWRMFDSRPLVERFVLPRAMIDQLERAVEPQPDS